MEYGSAGVLGKAQAVIRAMNPSFHFSNIPFLDHSIIPCSWAA